MHAHIDLYIYILTLVRTVASSRWSRTPTSEDNSTRSSRVT